MSEFNRAYDIGHYDGVRAERERSKSAIAATRATDPVVEANRDALLQRSNFGLKKYGVPLGNGDKTLPTDQIVQHALEEALDMANYLQTLKLALRRDADLVEQATRVDWSNLQPEQKKLVRLMLMALKGPAL